MILNQKNSRHQRAKKVFLCNINWKEDINVQIIYKVFEVIELRLQSIILKKVLFLFCKGIWIEKLMIIQIIFQIDIKLSYT